MVGGKEGDTGNVGWDTRKGEAKTTNMLLGSSKQTQDDMCTITGIVKGGGGKGVLVANPRLEGGCLQLGRREQAQTKQGGE